MSHSSETVLTPDLVHTQKQTQWSTIFDVSVTCLFLWTIERSIMFNMLLRVTNQRYRGVSMTYHFHVYITKVILVISRNIESDPNFSDQLHGSIHPLRNSFGLLWNLATFSCGTDMRNCAQGMQSPTVHFLRTSWDCTYEIYSVVGKGT